MGYEGKYQRSGGGRKEVEEPRVEGGRRSKEEVEKDEGRRRQASIGSRLHDNYGTREPRPLPASLSACVLSCLPQPVEREESCRAYLPQ